MDEKQLQALYDAMSAKLNLGDFQAFKTQVSGDAKFRKAFFDEASNELELGDYNTFESSFKKKDGTKPSMVSPSPSPFSFQDLSSLGRNRPVSDSRSPNAAIKNQIKAQDFAQQGKPMITVEEKAKQDIEAAKKKVRSTIETGDQTFARLIREDRLSAFDQELSRTPSLDGFVNPAAQTAKRETLMRSIVTPEEVMSKKQQAFADDKLAREVIKRNAKKDPELAKSAYLIDAEQRAAQDPTKTATILQNADRIASGELTYDVKKGILQKPEGVFNSAINGLKERNRQLEDYDFLANTLNDDAIISQLESDRRSFDPDSPIPVPEGTVAQFGQMIGSEGIAITKGAAAAVVTGAIPGAQAAIPYVAAFASTPEYYKRSFATAFRQAYNELREKGVDEREALATARKQAEAEGNYGAAEGFVSGAIGARIGLRPIKVGPGVKSSVTKALVGANNFVRENVMDGLLDGGVAGGLQIAKNIEAINNGLDRDLYDGVDENVAGELIFSVGMGLMTKGGRRLIDENTYKSLINGFARQPKETVDAKIGEMIVTGKMSPAEAVSLGKTIDAARAVDAQIPSTVTEDEKRTAIAEKIDERNKLKSELATSNEVFHKDINDKIAKLDKEIIDITNRPANEVASVDTPGPQVSNIESFEINKSAILDNTAAEVERLKTAELDPDDGVTLNMDGTKYEGGGLIVPIGSINTTQEQLTPELIANFAEQNKNKLSSGQTFKFGLYKFPGSNQVSIDLNIVTDPKNKDIALEFGKMAGQESLFDLSTFSNVPTGADGQNPMAFSDDQIREIGKAFEEGRMPNVFGGSMVQTPVERALEDAIPVATKSLEKSGIKFQVVDGSIDTPENKAARGNQGMFVAEDGTIIIDKSRLANEIEAGLVVWHEASHPVMNIIRNTNKPLYDKVVKGLEAAARQNQGVAKALSWAQSQEAYDNRATQTDEAVVETIGRINSGLIDIASLDTGLRQSLIDFVNSIAKFFGIDPILNDTDIAAFKKTVSDVANALKTGRDISGIVGEANVGEFQAPSVQARSIAEMKSNDVETKVKPGRKVSTRTPAGKGSPTDVHTSDAYIVNLEAQRESPDNYILNAVDIANYPVITGIKKSDIAAMKRGLVPKSKGGNEKDQKAALKVADKVYEKFVRAVADNLVWLHDQFNSDLRDISKRWYDGANKIAQDFASKFGVTTEQAAGVIAALSPQMDWYKNVSLAERVIDIVKNKKNFVFDQAMADKYIDIAGTLQKKKNESAAELEQRRDQAMADAREETAVLMGKPIGENTVLFPKALRAYDEVYNDKSYDILSPNADVIGKAKTKSGENAKIGWQGFKTIAKAISIAEDGSPSNISIQLGTKHKIRNFNNNIIDPNSNSGDVTIDTHAVAAGLLKPLAGADSEVKLNLSGKASKNTGSTGTYPAFADAYRLAAKEVGILPRQMQSITWEAVRGLFTDKYKSNKANKENINEIWGQYAQGKIDINDTRRQISDAAGGVKTPSWARSGDQALIADESSDNAGELLEDGTMGDDGGADGGNDGGGETGVVRSAAQRSVGNRESLIDQAGLTKKMTDDGQGNYVFFHYSGKKLNNIDPSKFGANLATGRDERPGVGISMYYVDNKTLETGVPSDFGYAVRIPKDKVYPFNEDPLNFYDQAKAEFEKDYPGQAFDANKQIGYITKVAGDNGFDITVADWNIKGRKALRAQTTKSLKPEIYKQKVFKNGSEREQFNEELQKLKPGVQASVGNRGPINWERSPEGKGDPSISSRNPIVVEAAKNLKEGKITNEEYRATVSENSPITPITRFFEPATESEVRKALSKDKVEKVNAPLADDTVVGLRLDIPAYSNNNTWVVSVHEGATNAGKAVSYRNVARITDVNFGVEPKAALSIAAGVPKTTIGRMFGKWQNLPGATMEEQGENAKDIVQSIINDPSYVQVGMNPFRHSYFYDRSNEMGRPIKSADEVIQIGGLVYAKNPVYGEWTDEAYRVKGLFDSAGKPVQFSVGNRGELLAPNGNPSNLTEQQYNQVRTPEFKNWFGDWENDPASASKVVDENGEPLVVFHGTRKSFDTFNTKANGVFFAKDPDVASSYAVQFDDSQEPNIIPAFLNIRSLETIDAKGNGYNRIPVVFNVIDSDTRGNAIYRTGVLSTDQIVETINNVRFPKLLLDEAKPTGVKIENVRDEMLSAGDPTEIYIALNSNQIKSATGNVGTFSTTDNRIQASVGNRPEDALRAEGEGKERDRALADKFGSLSEETQAKIDDDAVTYFQRPNKQTEKAVQDFIEGRSLIDMADYVLGNPDIPEVSKVWMAATVAKGLNAEIDAAKAAGDQPLVDALSKKQADIYNEYAKKATSLGQAVQAFIAFKDDPNAVEFFLPKILRQLKKAGVENVTDEQKSDILGMLKEVNSAAAGLPKDKAIIKLSHYLGRMAPMKPMDVLQAIWYAKILSGVTTQATNFFANVFNTMFELPAVGLRIALMSGNPSALLAGVKGFGSGVFKGAVAAADIVKTGVRSKEADKYFNESPLEYFTWSKYVGEKGKVLDKIPPINFGAWKYVGRLLAATDAFFSTANQEAIANMLAYAEAGDKVPSIQSFRNVNQMLGNTKENIQKAQAQAKAEGFTPGTLQAKRRVIEIIAQNRGEKLTSEADAIGKRITMNYDPEGWTKPIFDAVVGLQQNLPAIKMVIPFARIVANLTENALNYTPAGLVKAATGKRNPFNKKGTELTKEERIDMVSKFAIGMGSLAVLAANIGDDDDDWFEITAGGSNDPQKKYELMKGGWRPYTITFKDGTKLNYKDWPIAGILAGMGHIRDAKKYSFDDSTQSGLYATGFFLNFYDKSLLSGLSDFFGIFDVKAGRGKYAPDTKASERASKWAAQQVRSVAVSNLMQQTGKMYSELVTGDPQRDAKTFMEVIYRDIPVINDGIRPIIDVFGDPVQYNTTERLTPVSNPEKDQLIEWLNKNKLFVGVPQKRTIFDFDTMTERPMTDDEYYEYKKLSGKKTKEWIMNMMTLIEFDNRDISESGFEAAKDAARDLAYLEMVTNKK